MLQTAGLFQYGTYMSNFLWMQVSEDEARRMLAVADENHTGEIDFERFCYAVLNVTQSEFKLWIQEHLQRPIEVYLKT